MIVSEHTMVAVCCVLSSWDGGLYGEESLQVEVRCRRLAFPTVGCLVFSELMLYIGDIEEVFLRALQKQKLTEWLDEGTSVITQLQPSCSRNGGFLH